MNIVKFCVNLARNFHQLEKLRYNRTIKLLISIVSLKNTDTTLKNTDTTF